MLPEMLKSLLGARSNSDLNTGIRTDSKAIGVPLNAADPSQVTSGKNSISYNPELLRELRQNHDSLVQLCVKLNQFTKSRHYVEIQEQLEIFNLDFRALINRKNLYLLAFLESESATLSPAERLIVKAEKEKSRQFSIKTKDFLKKWRSSGVADSSVNQFRTEFFETSKDLNERCKKEESILFRLYRP